MSEKRSLYRSGTYAAYMASNFSSAARLSADEIDFVAARVRLLAALGMATAEDESAARAIARKALSQELKASKASDRSHDASRRGLTYKTVASHTSAALCHRERANELEDRAGELERAIAGRGKQRQPCGKPTCIFAIWNLPVRGSARMASALDSSAGGELLQWIAAWAIIRWSVVRRYPQRRCQSCQPW